MGFTDTADGVEPDEYQYSRVVIAKLVHGDYILRKSVRRFW
jgi:hypothetical protein